ncbi:hypothetical protein ES708_22897 [subsurface metagenome]
MSEKIETDCWCYAATKQVNIKGVIEGRREADLLKVTECAETKCLNRFKQDCLIDKIREGKWP